MAITFNYQIFTFQIYFSTVTGFNFLFSCPQKVTPLYALVLTRDDRAPHKWIASVSNIALTHRRVIQYNTRCKGATRTRTWISAPLILTRQITRTF